MDFAQDRRKWHGKCWNLHLYNTLQIDCSAGGSVIASAARRLAACPRPLRSSRQLTMMNARYNLAMNRSVEQQQIREDAAVVLEAIAAEPTWDGYLMFQLMGLAARAGDDQLLCYAVDEVDEYSHEFDTRNLPRGGAKGLIDSYKREFEQIADALRAGMTWEKYKRANHISEGEELSIALKATLTRIRRVFKRHSRTSV